MRAAVITDALRAAGEQGQVVRLTGVGDSPRVGEQRSLPGEPVEVRRLRAADDLAVAMVLHHHDDRVRREAPAGWPPGLRRCRPAMRWRYPAAGPWPPGCAGTGPVRRRRRRRTAPGQGEQASQGREKAQPHAGGTAHRTLLADPAGACGMAAAPGLRNCGPCDSRAHALAVISQTSGPRRPLPNPPAPYPAYYAAPMPWHSSCPAHSLTRLSGRPEILRPRTHGRPAGRLGPQPADSGDAPGSTASR